MAAGPEASSAAGCVEVGLPSFRLIKPLTCFLSPHTHTLYNLCLSLCRDDHATIALLVELGVPTPVLTHIVITSCIHPLSYLILMIVSM